MAVLCLLAGTAGAVNEGRFLRYPDIHDNRIVFTDEGDHWLAEIHEVIRCECRIEGNPEQAPLARGIHGQHNERLGEERFVLDDAESPKAIGPN